MANIISIRNMFITRGVVSLTISDRLKLMFKTGNCFPDQLCKVTQQKFDKHHRSSGDRQNPKNVCAISFQVGVSLMVRKVL